jgi:hypothetical protein
VYAGRCSSGCCVRRSGDASVAQDMDGREPGIAEQALSPVIIDPSVPGGDRSSRRMDADRCSRAPTSLAA